MPHQFIFTILAVIMQIFLFIIFITAIAYSVWFLAKGSVKKRIPISDILVSDLILREHISFYRRLDEPDKVRFIKDVKEFLQEILITPINTSITDLDKIFVAASAVIPIFSFPGFKYPHLQEILIYPDTFNMDFETNTDDRNIMGLVGTGVYRNKMLLSKTALQGGFGNNPGAANTAIHEFVHLIDGADGDTDGIPRILMDYTNALPWTELIHDEMQKMLEGNSDINPYGLQNRSEFFAVTAEYFFERPELFKENHPELFNMMQLIFKTK